MLKTLLASSLLVSALTLPALADSYDYRPVGGSNFGYQEAGGPRWDNGRGPGYDDRGGYEVAPPVRSWRMPPWRLARALNWQGYRHVRILDEKRDVTIVRASARGRDLILVVDARSGDVIRQRPADGWRGGGNGPGWGRY